MAHSVVYAAAQAAIKEKRFLNATLWDNARVREVLGSKAALEALLDPASYTGQSAAFAEAQSRRGMEVAKQLEHVAAQLEECAGLWALERAAAASQQGPSAEVKTLEQKCAALAGR